METLLIAALLGLIPALIAHGKGRSFGCWWVYGALLFIVAIVHSIIIKGEPANSPRNRSNSERECPFCAESIKYQATKCKHCGSAVSAIEPPKPKYSGTQIAWQRVGVLLAFIIVIALIASQKGQF